MKRRLSIISFLGLLAVAVGATVPAASAQTGYPPGACTTLTGTQDVGSVTVGQQFVLQVAPTCAFTAGATLTVTINGVSIPGKVASVDGLTRITITVISSTQLSIDDPVITPAICGVNTAIVTGPSAVSTSGSVTQTATFTVICPVTTAVATPVQGRLSLTGANVAKWGAIALAMLVVGSLFVFGSRRRSQTGG